jgi:hypothetical protein
MDKAYLIVLLGGRFKEPEVSSSPLLALQCGQAIRPYIESEDENSALVLVNAQITNLKVEGASQIDISEGIVDLQVNITVDGIVVAEGAIPLNATRHELSLSLENLKPRSQAYEMMCTASAGSQTFQASSILTYLPTQSNGSVTKIDVRTGALLARPLDRDGNYTPIFVTGFYTQFGNYLAQNLSVISELKEQG